MVNKTCTVTCFLLCGVPFHVKRLPEISRAGPDVQEAADIREYIQYQPDQELIFFILLFITLNHNGGTRESNIIPG